jgi:hypothetical protein
MPSGRGDMESRSELFIGDVICVTIQKRPLTIARDGKGPGPDFRWSYQD